MKSVIKSIPAVFVSVLLIGCASAPKVSERQEFTLASTVPIDSNLSIADNRRQVTADKWGCEPIAEYNYSDFKTTPIDFFARTIPAEVASLEPSGETYRWLTKRNLSLLEFRAIGGKLCAASIDPRRNAGMAAISPAGPAFGMLLDSLVAQAKRQAFVQWRVTIGIEGQEITSEAMSTSLDGPRHKVFEPVAQSIARSLAEKIIEYVRKNELSKK